MARLIAAFFLGVPIPVIVLGGLQWRFASPDEALIILTTGIWITYCLAALIGTPLFLLLRHLGWIGWWQISLLGMLCFAAIPASLFHSSHVPQSQVLSLVAISLTVGAASGWAFWLLGVRGNRALTAASTRTREDACR